jgi:hypothetical protein
VERRRKHGTRHTRGSLNEEAVTNLPASSLPDLPYLTEIIEQGGISVGIISPVSDCVAVAHEGTNTLAMLVRREGETLLQLLTRLDFAIARAQADDIFTDEVNPPRARSAPSRSTPSLQYGEKRTLTEISSFKCSISTSREASCSR